MTLNCLLIYKLLLLAFLFKISKEDLPVHCLKHEVIGKWKIKATNLMRVKSGYEMRCGHKLPSNKETSWKAEATYPLVNEYELELTAFDVAILFINGIKKTGKWTMVYDEGFSLEFEEFSFFTFFKYSIEPEKGNISYKSFCHSTLPGWYNNKEKSGWGCFKASKSGVSNKNEATFVKIKNNFQNDPSHNLNKVSNYNKITYPSAVDLMPGNPTAFPTAPSGSIIHSNPAENGLIVMQDSTEFPVSPPFHNLGGFHPHPIGHAISPFGAAMQPHMGFMPYDSFSAHKKPSIIISPNIYNFKQVNYLKKNKRPEYDYNPMMNIKNNETITFNKFDELSDKELKNKDSREKQKDKFLHLNDEILLDKNRNYIDIEKMQQALKGNEEKDKGEINNNNDTSDKNENFDSYDNNKKKLILNLNKVEELNKIKKSWEAGLYKDFAFYNDNKNKVLNDLNNINNRKANIVNDNKGEVSKTIKNLSINATTKLNNKLKNEGFLTNASSMRFKNKAKTLLKKSNSRAKTNKQILEPFYAAQSPEIKVFPTEFNWINLLRPAARQGNCGSCYAISALRMAEARLRLFYNHIVELSVQHVLDCSYYNQGCDGGYSYLVMKFANEFELIPKSCKVHTGTKSKCENTCNILKLPYIYRMIDYKYLGGSYGKCSESLMMDELKTNGPFVVSFESDVNFVYYKSGIYHSMEQNKNPHNNFMRSEWTKIDHSVLLVGWGEDQFTKEKYWLLQNTWGPEWGEDGFFRVRRGTNEMGIESTCETGIPIIIDNLTNTPIVPNGNKFLPKSHSDNIEKLLNTQGINKSSGNIPKEKGKAAEKADLKDLITDEVLNEFKFLLEK